jgi:hypothetical protein
MIPKIIHYFWIGGKPIPPADQLCIDSWKRHMPDYDIIQWDESNYDFNKVPYMKEAYGAKKWGFVPDYARLDILYKYGGLYFDTDVEIIRSFDDMLHQKAFSGFEKDHQKLQINIGSGAGTEQGNMMFKAMRDDYIGRHFVDSHDGYNTVPSPVIQTGFLQKYGLKLNDSMQVLNDITIYPCEYFSPLNMTTGEINKTINTHSIHNYNASWMSPADIERRKLRIQYYKKYGKFSTVVSTVIAYRKHYGLGAFKEIFIKLMKR